MVVSGMKTWMWAIKLKIPLKKSCCGVSGETDRVLWKFWLSHRQTGHGCGDRQLPDSAEEAGKGAWEIQRLPLREQSEQNQRNMRETQSTQCFLQGQVVRLQKAQTTTTRSDVAFVNVLS